MVINNDSQPLVVGMDVPAEIGMSLEEVCTPSLIVDLDAFEKNVATLRDFITKAGVRFRAGVPLFRQQPGLPLRP